MQLPKNIQVISKPEGSRKSEIEKAGKQVMDHLLTLGRTSDLSYPAMAKRINELYALDINERQIMHFFKTNVGALMRLAEEEKTLSQIRAELYLEHSAVLVKDIKILDEQITKLIDDDGPGKYLEVDKKAKTVSDLIDKKGRLLIRHARLSGKLQDQKITNVEKMQNIYLEINNQKSELINRLKKADFKETIDLNKTINVKNEKEDNYP